jgi:hypothetical protein
METGHGGGRGAMIWAMRSGAGADAVAGGAAVLARGVWLSVPGCSGGSAHGM